MNCKDCKFYDNSYDGFCTKDPRRSLKSHPSQMPNMVCNGDDYVNKNENVFNEIWKILKKHLS